MEKFPQHLNSDKRLNHILDLLKEITQKQQKLEEINEERKKERKKEINLHLQYLQFQLRILPLAKLLPLVKLLVMVVL